MLFQPFIAWKQQPALFYTLTVFSSQNSGGERAPGSTSDAVFLEHGFIFNLESGPVEQVVLGLFHGRGNEMQSLSKLVGFCYLPGAPFAGSPVEGVALINQI